MKSNPSPTLSLADALLPKTRQRVLAVLFGQPDRTFYASELIAMSHSGSGSVQRELADLTQVGILNCTKIGNQKHYQANSGSPVFEELRGLVLKTVGLGDQLRLALASLAPQIFKAFVFGSIAKGQDSAMSDVDLLIVSDQLTYGDLFSALERTSQTLGRRINPVIYTRKDFKKRQLSDNAFIQRVMQQPKIWLIGQEESPEDESTVTP
jgi:predicted nucleotidyltransferase